MLSWGVVRGLYEFYRGRLILLQVFRCRSCVDQGPRKVYRIHYNTFYHGGKVYPRNKGERIENNSQNC